MSDKIYQQLSDNIHQWGKDLGFEQLGITDIDLAEHETHLQHWLDQDFHGEMAYMASHGTKRSRPAELVESTCRVIVVRMNYLNMEPNAAETIDDEEQAYVARYALGRDYHKLIRSRLVKLWNQIRDYLDTALDAGSAQPDSLNGRGFNGRVFTDSAPILEKALAEKAGLGWIGKNTLLLNRGAGSWFFLGEIFTDIPLPLDIPYTENHCGTCTSCMQVCPTDAIIAPYQLDARKCISYLTIEYKGSIPEHLRSKMGNRIFGCDDCQVFCPWNKFAQQTSEMDFSPRNNLDHATLLELFNWTEAEFSKRTEGSAIRRSGFEGWQRNIAVALGNAHYSEQTVKALKDRLVNASELVAEHIDWAIKQQQQKSKRITSA